ncbi:MAG: mechanosensitive ion channel family protein [Opitutaceae bacterium]
MAVNIQETLRKLWEKLTGWVEQFILLLPNLLIAIAVFVVFWVVARQIGKYAHKLLRRLIHNDEVAGLAAVLIHLSVIGAGLVVSLGVLGLDKTLTSVLAGAGLVGLALALAFQDLGQNILAGVYILMRRTIRSGDFIETNGHYGAVRRINLRATHLETPRGPIAIVPNREVFQNTILNYSTGHYRVDLAAGVSYGDDLEKVRQVTIAAVEGVPKRIEERPVQFFFNEFAESSINFVVRFWIPFQRRSDFREAQSEAIIRIKSAFDEHGITIPFPIRTLDFGIVGGEKLEDALRKSNTALSADPETKKRLDSAEE